MEIWESGRLGGGGLMDWDRIGTDEYSNLRL